MHVCMSTVFAFETAGVSVLILIYTSKHQRSHKPCNS